MTDTLHSSDPTPADRLARAMGALQGVRPEGPVQLLSEHTIRHRAHQELSDLRTAHPQLFRPKLVISNPTPRDGQRMTFSPLPALFKIDGALTPGEP